MKGKKDDRLWEEFTKTNDGIAKCNHCGAEFKGKPSTKRLRNHLLQFEGSGIKCCPQVPEHVKNALANASTSSIRPRIESSSAINNNELNNQGGSEQPWQEAPQHIGESFEGSDTSAHYRRKDACRTGPCPSSNEEVQPTDPYLFEELEEFEGMMNQMMQTDIDSEPPDPSFNGVNNLRSTSALQQRYEFQEGVIDEEWMRANQECSDATNEELFPTANFEVEGGSIRSCTQVLDHVENALADASTSSKRPRIEPPSSINNNDLDNQGQGDNGQQMHEQRQRIQDCLEGSFTSAQNRWDNTSELGNMMAEMGNNNSASTSAPQHNNDSQNQMQADQVVVQGTDKECSVMPESSGDWKQFPTKKLVGATFQKNMQTVLEWLMSDKVSSIGIYGMGGVGKTTLLTHVHNRIQKNKSKYGDVYWITVSRDFSVEKLQNCIAKRIHLDFDNEEDLKERAAKLSKELRRKSKFVLILDDLWNHFDEEMIGIPTEVIGGNLIVTTRSLQVCRQINCQEKLKVEPLSKNEAWKLLLHTLGHDLALEVKQIAKSIVEECAGLPLGIVTVAGSMREEDDIHVWENALTELQNSEVWNDNMEDKVFNILKFSYDRLNKQPQVQKCLLYCALYPEDFEIEKEELIKHLIVERIIERKNSRKQEFDKGYTILNELEKCCLLECKYGHKVKMHDLIRDMAIQIMRECSPSLVEAGKGMTCLPEKRWWTEDTVRVSLMKNHIMEIPPLFSPRCPNLSTLLLCDNNLKSIAESFFYNLHGLKLLNLSGTEIENLPISVADLENLTALILRDCDCLTSLPSLRKLKALEILDLFGCTRFEMVPEGLESLFNLDELNLLHTGVKELPAGILTNLSHLQFLGFAQSSGEIKAKGEELGRLCNLETLFWRFQDGEDFNNYMQTEKQHLSNYMLFVGPPLYRPLYRRPFDFHMSQHLLFEGCEMSREVLLPNNVQKLNIDSVTIHNGRSLCLKNAFNLKELNIEWCKEIEYLFCLYSSTSTFETLEVLEVSCMENLRGLFGSEGDDGLPPPTPRLIQLCATFSRLKEFKIDVCHGMKNLFPYALLPNLQNLQILQVLYCDKMEEIIASEEEEEGCSSHSIFTLPNLRNLCLCELPKLKSICNAKLKCDSLEYVKIYKCPALKKIPILHPLSSLKKIEVIEVKPEEWWEWAIPTIKLSSNQSFTSQIGSAEQRRQAI